MAKIAKRAQNTIKSLVDKAKNRKKKSGLKKAVTDKTKAISSSISVAKEKIGKTLSPKKSLFQREPTTREKLGSLLKSKSKK